MSLQGKIAVITGASRGIGRAIAVRHGKGRGFGRRELSEERRGRNSRGSMKSKQCTKKPSPCRAMLARWRAFASSSKPWTPNSPNGMAARSSTSL